MAQGKGAKGKFFATYAERHDKIPPRVWEQCTSLISGHSIRLEDNTIAAFTLPDDYVAINTAIAYDGTIAVIAIKKTPVPAGFYEHALFVGKQGARPTRCLEYRAREIDLLHFNPESNDPIYVCCEQSSHEKPETNPAWTIRYRDWVSPVIRTGKSKTINSIHIAHDPETDKFVCLVTTLPPTLPCEHTFIAKVLCVSNLEQQEWTMLEDAYDKGLLLTSIGIFDFKPCYKITDYNRPIEGGQYECVIKWGDWTSSPFMRLCEKTVAFKDGVLSFLAAGIKSGIFLFKSGSEPYDLTLFNTSYYSNLAGVVLCMQNRPRHPYRVHFLEGDDHGWDILASENVNVLSLCVDSHHRLHAILVHANEQGPDEISFCTPEEEQVRPLIAPYIGTLKSVDIFGEFLVGLFETPSGELMIASTRSAPARAHSKKLKDYTLVGDTLQCCYVAGSNTVCVAEYPLMPC
ncbi:MAG: hypothetical protein ABIH21_01310 [Patescibacteria group bacterium]